MLRSALFAAAALFTIGQSAVGLAQGVAGTDGLDIATTLEQSGPTVSSQGGGGTGGTPAGNGGAGGDVVVTATTFTTPHAVDIKSTGGKAGQDPGAAPKTGIGGTSGDISYTDTAAVTATSLTIVSTGGSGHSGGNSGAIAANIAGEYQSSVSVVTNGGFGQSRGNHGGDAGDVTVVFSGKTDKLYVVSNGGPGPLVDPGGSGGDSGNVSVTLRGKADEVELMSVPGWTNANNEQGRAGTINVRLENGAEVSGGIKVDGGGGGVAILTLAFELANQGDVDAANASLAGSAGSGSITVGGQSYRWDGFTSLVNQIAVLRAQNPGAPITVSVDSGSSSTETVPRSPGSRADRLAALNAKPTVVGKLACDTRSVNAFRLSNGAITVNVKVGGKYYAAGTLVAGKFVPAPGSLWTISAAGEGLQVTSDNGEVLATCSI